MHDYGVFILRVKDLLARLKKAYPDKEGKIVFFAGLETEEKRFLQESSFYYFTGLQEPALVLTVDLNGYKTLYVPNCMQERAKWVVSPLEIDATYAKKIGVDEIKLLGSTCVGYQMHPFFAQSEYSNFIADLKESMSSDASLFVLHPSTSYGYIEQRFLLQRLQSFGCRHPIVDISSIVADMRRTKDTQEIEYIYKAIEITALAQEAAARAIAAGANESEVQASLEYVMTASQANIAFPSIVASGKNATILHYMFNSTQMKKGDVVVVDIGARYKGYCADITRAYPVSGVFNKRQKEIYALVLETQEYIASLAKPGMWLSCKDHPEQSLHHLAREFLRKKGYDQYFPHGIGHFLGLDVHDVGDYTQPLRVGDVITIEPGIYIPQEQIGVRIEDNYWIVKEGSICLSENLPKSIQDVQAMAGEKL